MPTDTEEAKTGLGSVVMCSKCHQNPRANSDSTNTWCLACRADYQRTYEAGKSAKIKDLGFGKGAEAMRRALMEKLGQMAPVAMISVQELRRWIAEFPTPRPE
jgi:hypothetical protein